MSENKNISQDVVAHMAQLSRLAVSDEEKIEKAIARGFQCFPIPLTI